MKFNTRLLPVFVLFSCVVTAQEPLYNYSIFANSRMEGAYFFSRVVERSPSVLKNSNNKLPLNKSDFHTPGNALQLEYTNAPKGNWQAAIYRENIRGQDHFKSAKFLSLWIHISVAGDLVNLPAIQLIKKDTILSAVLPTMVKGSGQWKQVLATLNGENTIVNAEDIIGISFSQPNEDGLSYQVLVDDVEFLAETKSTAISTVPIIESISAGPRHIDIAWPSITDTTIRYVKVYRSHNGSKFIPIGVQSTLNNRFTDFTGITGQTFLYKISLLNNGYEESPLSETWSAKTVAITDTAMLTMVQEAAFRYYWDGAEKNSGLAKENISGRNDMIASGASGFGIMALLVGTERKFITRDQSVNRFLKIVHFLEKAETFHGAFPHFINAPTGKVEPFFGNRDNGGDLVETSFLMQGLLAARAYFKGDANEEKMIRDKITAIWNRVEWAWYRQYPDSKFLYWHWSPDQAWVINHNLIGWNETMVTYLLAIASPTHSVPASMYYTGWANHDSTGQQYRKGWGGTPDGSMYSNGKTYSGIKLDVGVSNGGPLFFTHYSYLGYDPHLINDRYTNYFKNNRNIALINYRYCLQNPGRYQGYGADCWGLTASDGPRDYNANEPVLRQDRGVIAPTGAISSFPYTPQQSMKALKNYYNQYGHFLWGEYGFRDAFSLTENWCSEIYMGLNQAPMTVMIENYRSGLLWKLFMSDPDVQQGLQRLNAETAKYKK